MKFIRSIKNSTVLPIYLIFVSPAISSISSNFNLTHITKGASPLNPVTVSNQHKSSVLRARSITGLVNSLGMGEGSA